MALYDDVDGARAAVDAAGRLTARMIDHLGREVVRQGRVSSSALDTRQLDAFRLTGLLAEQAAARALLAWAARVDTPLARGLAMTVAAEAAASAGAEGRSRARSWGLDGAALAATVEDPAVADTVGRALEGSHWTALGTLVRAQGGGDAALDEEREMIRREFRRFAEARVAPVAEHVHREDALIPADIITSVAELGRFGLSIPERYGGLQPDDAADNLGMCVVTEELSRGSLGVAGSLITRPEILSKALLEGGTEAQREGWLPRLASGEVLCAVAVTEPDFGSDVAGLKVAATPTEGGWLLNGQKTWCTFAGYADLLMVLARTDPDPEARHRGLSILLVEKPRFEGHQFDVALEGGGRITGRAIDTLGYRGMHSFDLFFEDVFVPSSHVVGEAGLGRGFYYQMKGFAGGRLQTAARATGVMQAAFDRALAYAEERRVFGRPVAEFGLTAWKLGRMAAIIQAARQLTYETARQLDAGEGAMEAALVKLWASRQAEWVTREAQQIHGGMGYAEEYDVSRYFVDARVFSIFEGAEEVLALRVVAREVLQRWHDEAAGGGAA